MSNFVFNNAKGKVGYYATLPLPGDALIAVPITTASIQTDSILMTYTNLAQLLGGGNVEQTQMGRKTLTGVSATANHSTSTFQVDVDDFIYTAATGAPISAIVICYIPEPGESTDSEIILLTKHDFSAIPNGGDIPVQINTSGIFVAASLSS